MLSVCDLLVTFTDVEYMLNILKETRTVTMNIFRKKEISLNHL